MISIGTTVDQNGKPQFIVTVGLICIKFSSLAEAEGFFRELCQMEELEQLELEAFLLKKINALRAGNDTFEKQAEAVCEYATAMLNAWREKYEEQEQRPRQRG